MENEKVNFKSTDEKPEKDKTIQGQALPDFPTSFGLTKDQVSKIKIGDEITVKITGTVIGLRETAGAMVPGMEGANNQQKMIEVQLKTKKVMEVESNSADMELRRMTSGE